MNFWSTKAGLLIRWLIYLPLGLVALKVVEIGCAMFLGWLFRDMRGLVIIGFLFGGLIFVYFAGLLYYGAIRVVAAICPSPRPGMIVFATIYGVIQLSTLAGAIMEGWHLVAASTVISSCIMAFAVWHIWEQGRQVVATS